MFSEKWQQICNEGEDEFNQLFMLKNLSLEQLLDNENCLSQFANENHQLIEFLKSDNNLLKLIKYVSELPPSDSDMQRAYRYPFFSCQMLKEPQKFILDSLLEKSQFFNQLTAHIYQPIINDVLAGYLFQILENLQNTRTQQFLQIIYDNSQFIDALFSHTESQSICKIFSLLLCFDSEVEIQEDYVGLLLNQRKRIVDKILQIVVQSKDKLVLENIFEILEVLVNFNANFSGQILLDYLVNNQHFLNMIPHKYQQLLELINKILNQLTPSGRKSPKDRLMFFQYGQINTTKLEEALMSLIAHELPKYTENDVQKHHFRVADLQFFILMSRFSGLQSTHVRKFFFDTEIWCKLIRCMLTHPSVNMMHSEIVKIIRNGIKYAVDERIEIKNLESLFDYLQKILYNKNKCELFYGYVVQIAFQFKQRAEDLHIQNMGIYGKTLQILIESWMKFDCQCIQKLIDDGDVPLNDLGSLDPNSPLNLNIVKVEDLEMQQDNIINQSGFSPIKLKIVEID